VGRLTPPFVKAGAKDSSDFSISKVRDVVPGGEEITEGAVGRRATPLKYKIKVDLKKSPRNGLIHPIKRIRGGKDE